MQDNRKYAIYSRKSKFTGKGESIENQIEFCKNYIKLQEPNISDDDILIFEDEGFSGGNTNRPKFKEMMNEVKQNHIKAVVCYRLDRISRNIADFSVMYQTFNDMNVDFLSVSEKYDTSTPSGRAMLSMCTVFAQMERETIAERIRDNMHELAKTGRWLGGVTPTGYKSSQIVNKITIDGKQRKAYKLDIIKDEADIVRLIYNKFLETGSLTKTDAYLLQNHIKTKNGKEFTRFSIRAILANPVYLIADSRAYDYFLSQNIEIYSDREEFDGKHGIMAYNKTIQKAGKANRLKDITEWIISVGKHEGIISSDEWIRVQNLLQINKSKSYRKPKTSVALLSGLLFCGKCGSFMRPKLTKRLNKDGDMIYSYLCQTKERSRCKNCNSKNPNGNELDKLVCEEIKKLSEDDSEFIKGIEKAKKDLRENNGHCDDKLNNLKSEFSENRNKIDSLVMAIANKDGSMAFDYITDSINKLDEKNKAITKQIEEIENTNKSAYTYDDFDVLKDLLQSFAKSFDTMSVEQKRQALRVFVKKIIWDGENVHIVLFGGDENEIDFSSFEEDCAEPLGADSKRNTDVFSL